MVSTVGAAPIEFPLRLAAIDIGSNALRFSIAEFTGAEAFVLLESRRVPVRLGHAAFRSRHIDPERIEQAVEAVATFRERMDAVGVRHYRAVATSAVRESENGSELIERVRAETGLEVEPITGAEEGRLVWRAIRARLPLAGRRWLLADLGGGSLELSFAESHSRRWTESLPLGAVRLLEELGAEGNRTPPFEKLRPLIEAYAGAAIGTLPHGARVEALIATGGNADVLAELAAAPPDASGVRRLTRSRLVEMIDQLAPLSYEERMARFNLREDRADVILPAAIVYERLALIAGTETIVVPGVGLKEGVMLDLLDELRSHSSRQAALTHELEESAIALGRRHQFDEAHGRQVARLALRLYDCLQSLHGLDEADRRILLAAAILHDIGKFVTNRKHHKHSRYLIRHAELPGLSRADIKLAALVARYHRGSGPKRSHKEYGGLSDQDRRRVRTLAALLRVGDALDREHRQEVQEMTVRSEDDAVHLHVVTAGETPLDLWALRKKGKLFERVFGRRLQVARMEATAPIRS